MPRGARPRTVVDEFGRECTQCQTYKPWSDFYVKNNGCHGHMAKCKTCVNPDLIPRSRVYQHALKRKTMDAYGGKCACCGESELAFLTIDHVNNDGATHRREIRSVGGNSTYLWLKRNNYPAGFQVLCANCNLGRQVNGGICPHAS